LIATLDRDLEQTISIETGDLHTTVRERLNPEANERDLLMEFQRGAHHHYNVTPGPDEVTDWLALMRHYGAPARVLDWTRSPYVALYFALQGDSTEDSVLWGIDLKWLEDRSNELLHQSHEDYPSSSDVNARRQYINRVILANDNAHPIIVATSPRQLNERMIAQQGELPL
jgi:hypothetical protein